MLKKRNRKTSGWGSVQKNFSELLQHEKKKKISKLDETRLSQRIEDDDTSHSQQLNAESINLLNDDDLANSQLIEDDDSAKLFSSKFNNMQSRVENSCHQDSVDLMLSPAQENESTNCTNENIGPKSGFVTPLHHKNLFSSPIIENVTPKRQSAIFSESLLNCCTPTTSKFGTITKRTRTPTGTKSHQKLNALESSLRQGLIPLSPITPGLDWSNFSSVFSVHVNETSLLNEADQTTLAIPLDVTDDQIDEFTQEITKNEETEITENFKAQIQTVKPKNVLNTTGSDWIKNVQDKIDEDWKKRAAKLSENTSFFEDASLYDSGKKSKFIKGGFAEKLTKVLKKEHSQKSVFLQKLQTKKLRKEDRLTLKILSNVKEGLLRIIECKTVENDENVTQSSPYTLILPEEFAASYDLKLGTDICVYQPFQTLKMNSSETTVLLAAYNIITKSADEGTSEDSENSTLPLSQNYENLLKCLEAHTGCDESISIVATIQRIFSQFKSPTEIWSLLCIDAYGTIFLVDSQNFSSSSNLIRLLTHGEGQRVIFKNLVLKDRMKRSQYPSLFSIVDSIWDSTGSVLLHSSGSQNSAEFTSLLPPSYCYFLNTDETSSVFFLGKEVDTVCVKTDCGKKSFRIISDLNRVYVENVQKCSRTDVLYSIPKSVKISDVFDEKFENRRFSIVCRFVEFKTIVDCDSQDLYCSQHNDNDVTLIVKDYDITLAKLDRNYEVVAKNSCLLPHNIDEGSILVFKDVQIVSHVVVADELSRVKLVDCICEGKHFLNLNQSDDLS